MSENCFLRNTTVVSVAAALSVVTNSPYELLRRGNYCMTTLREAARETELIYILLFANKLLTLNMHAICDQISACVL